MAIVGVNLIQFFRIQWISINPVLNMDMLMRKNNRRMSVVISRSFSVVDFKILRNLIFINFEEKVRLSLNITIHILCQSLSLLTLELLLKVKSVNLLLDKLSNASLDLFQVIMITLIDLRDLSIDSLFLLRWSQLREPLCLSSYLLTLLFVVGLRVRLEFLKLAAIESCVIDFWLGCLSSFLSLNKILDSYTAKSAFACRSKQAWQEGLVCCCTLKEHIF